MLEISLLSRIEHPASATSEIIAFSFHNRARNPKMFFLRTIQDERRKKAEHILSLARQSCKGLSKEKLAAIESARL